eukprot:GHVU01118371.1.p1 GENE.GHVU01118371.1~~GHVU01118371.1.p1  ORF type:complete len:156 (-),score=25.19 GHVU01118371.1:395-862(-)
MQGPHNFQHIIRDLPGHGQYFSLPDLKDDRYEKLPYSIRVLLESAVRNCDGVAVPASAAATILDWAAACRRGAEVPFKPARVLLQDFTGVPALVDLAAMRDATAALKGDANAINPLVPVDLVVDHSVQVDFAKQRSLGSRTRRWNTRAIGSGSHS